MSNPNDPNSEINTYKLRPKLSVLFTEIASFYKHIPAGPKQQVNNMLRHTLIQVDKAAKWQPKEEGKENVGNV